MPEQFNLVVSARHVDMIGAALGRLPHDDVRPLIDILTVQVKAQQEQARKAAEEKAAAEKKATDAK